MNGQIEWPERYAPQRVAARVSNEIAICAAPDVVWRCLIRAAAWPEWYPNCADVRIDGSGGELGVAGRVGAQLDAVALELPDLRPRQAVAAAKTVRHGKSSDGFSGWAPVSVFRPLSAWP